MEPRDDQTVTFEDPPLREVVLGIQFDRIVRWRAAHAGMFLSECAQEYAVVDECEPIVHVREPSQEQHELLVALLNQAVPIPQPPRVRCTNKDRTRMLQIQADRLHVNWLREGPYPRYSALRDDFRRIVSDLQDFLQRHGIGALRPDLWELTYVNLVPRGELWESPGDWHRVIRMASTAMPVPLEEWSLAAARIDWAFHMRGDFGNIYVALMPQAHLRQDALRFTITARGPATSLESALEGLDRGHGEVVELFQAIPTERCHRLWRLKTP